MRGCEKGRRELCLLQGGKAERRNITIQKRRQLPKGHTAILGSVPRGRGGPEVVGDEEVWGESALGGQRIRRGRRCANGIEKS